MGSAFSDTSLAVHGGNIQELSRRLRRESSDFIDFSSNTHAFAQDITAALADATPVEFAVYPDTNCTALREAIAAHEGLTPALTLPGNGSADLIWLAMTALAPRKVLFIGPVFSEYVRACLAFDIPFDIITPPAEQAFICGPAELRRIWDSDADLTVLCTPNNPAATTYPNIAEMLGILRTPRLLVDGTYKEFLWGQESYRENNWHAYRAMLRPGVALFCLHSVTKFFAAPGIRLGYLLADEVQLRRFSRIRPPWSVSSFAQAMGIAFLNHIEAYRERLIPLKDQLASLARTLRRMDSFIPDQVFEGPSFITAAISPNFRPRLSAETIREKLLRQGLIIRNCDTIPGMPPGFLRFQARPAEDAEALIKALFRYEERGWRGEYAAP